MPIYTPDGLEVIDIFTPEDVRVATIYNPEDVPIYQHAVEGAVDCAVSIVVVSQTDAPVNQAVLGVTVTGFPFPRVQRAFLVPATADSDQWTTANLQSDLDGVHSRNNAKYITPRVIHNDSEQLGDFRYFINVTNGMSSARAAISLHW